MCGGDTDVPGTYHKARRSSDFARFTTPCDFMTVAAVGAQHQRIRAHPVARPQNVDSEPGFDPGQTTPRFTPASASAGRTIQSSRTLRLSRALVLDPAAPHAHINLGYLGSGEAGRFDEANRPFA